MKSFYNSLLGASIEIITQGATYCCFVAGIDPDRGVTLASIDTGEALICFFPELPMGHTSRAQFASYVRGIRNGIFDGSHLKEAPNIEAHCRFRSVSIGSVAAKPARQPIHLEAEEVKK